MTNRQIKFRAWLPVIKKMTYVHTLDELMNWGTRETDNKTAIWLQYTGLLDKNGKEIYEGDIFKSIRGYKAVVEWVDDGRFLGFTTERSIVYVGQEPAVEIIGNIYENPEVVEGKTDE
jgi:hypothetical protein